MPLPLGDRKWIRHVGVLLAGSSALGYLVLCFDTVGRQAGYLASEKFVPLIPKAEQTEERDNKQIPRH